MRRLKKRRDFLRAQKGRRQNTGLFSLQAVRREPPDGEGPRIGLTVSKANGNAVRRNRIRRRLREALRRQAGDLPALAFEDYVIVARPATLSASFEMLAREVHAAFLAVQRPARSGR
jgi:ribonuclease P protein component